MAAHFISIIVDALKQYDNNTETDEFYEALAWQGLKGNTDENGVFHPNVSWENLPQDEKDNINQTYNNFYNDNTNYPDGQ